MDNIKYLVDKFVREINPNYKLSKSDIEYLKQYIEGNGYYSSKIYVNGKLCKDIDAEVMKYFKVKDFSFLPRYESMCSEYLYYLKGMAVRKFKSVPNFAEME